MQVAVLGEGLVAPCAVYRNSPELSAMFAELGKDLIAKGHLVATDRAPICGIESKDDRPSPQITERKPLVGRDPQLEIWSGRTGGKDLGHSLRLLLPCPRLDTRMRLDTAPGSFTLTAINPVSCDAGDGKGGVRGELTATAGVGKVRRNEVEGRGRHLREFVELLCADVEDP
jgi:hypothetical protein